MRRSPELMYYNKIDRLKNWKGELLSSHRPPLVEFAEALTCSAV
jgi:hypothetical protein